MDSLSIIGTPNGRSGKTRKRRRDTTAVHHERHGHRCVPLRPGIRGKQQTWKKYTPTTRLATHHQKHPLKRGVVSSPSHPSSSRVGETTDDFRVQKAPARAKARRTVRSNRFSSVRRELRRTLVGRRWKTRARVGTTL